MNATCFLSVYEPLLHEKIQFFLITASVPLISGLAVNEIIHNHQVFTTSIGKIILRW